MPAPSGSLPFRSRRDPPTATPRRLGIAQRLVGAREQRIRGRPRREVEHDTDARPDFQRRSVTDRDRFRQALDHPCGDGDDLGLGDVAGTKDGELVSADASELIGRAHHRRQPAGDHAQRRVSREASEPVVDVFEAVDVDVQHRPAGHRPRPVSRAPGNNSSDCRDLSAGPEKPPPATAPPRRCATS